MSEYECTVIYDASSNCTVDADSVEGAIDQAYEKAGGASLCHHCSRNLDLGDVVGVIVYKDGTQVTDTTHASEQIAALRTEAEALRKDAERLQWMFDEECHVHGYLAQDGLRYGLVWPSLKEEQADLFLDPRTAIDAAMEVSR